MTEFFAKLFSHMNVYLAHLQNDACKYPIHEGLQEVDETFFHKKFLFSKEDIVKMNFLMCLRK